MNQDQKIIEEFNKLSAKLVKAKVGKYVYHLTRKRTREGIDKNGLMKVNYEKGAVFAHNTDRFDLDWYWFCLDIYDYELTSYWNCYTDHLLDNKSIIRFYVNYFYDIWRIDTEKAEKTWYIDFIGRKSNEHKKKDFYLKCFKPIKREAITLCTLDIDSEFEVQNTDGQVVTCYNPIIPRDEFIEKHGFMPEEEVLKVVNEPKYFDLNTEHNQDEFYWKRLNKLKFSLQDEISLSKVA